MERAARLRSVAPVAVARLTLTILAVAFAGCGGSGGPVGRLEGLVTLGPLTPVEQVGGPPSERVYQASIEVREQGGGRVATVSSGKDGRFSVSLPAGRYTLVPGNPTDSPLPYAAPVNVVIESGGVTKVTIAFDTGIRAAESPPSTTP